MKRVLYIFGRMSDDDIEWLIANGKKESFPAGEVIIRKDQPIDKIYIGLEGIFSVFVGENEDKKVAELGSGEIVGEMSFVDTSLPSATVKAEQQAILYSIPRSKLNRKIAEDDGFASRFYHALAIFLADRLRSSSNGLYGYGDTEYKDMHKDELDSLIMDNVSLAGDRFHRMLTRMIKDG